MSGRGTLRRFGVFGDRQAGIKACRPCRPIAKNIGLGALILVAGGVAAMLLARAIEKGDVNFHVVAPGILYRSGHMAPEHMSEIVRRYKLKTIVNLRTDVKFAAAGLREKAWVEERGLRYVYLPVGSTADLPQVQEFLEIVTRPENQPVLTHCHHGKDRTGVLVAAYRICVEGWSAQKAGDEMIGLGASRHFYERHLPLLRTLEKTDWRGAVAPRRSHQ